MRLSRADRWLLAASFFGSLLLLEGGLRGLERWRGVKFTGLAERFAEEFFFHTLAPEGRERYLRSVHDPLLGWRNHRADDGSHPVATVTPEGWRGPSSTAPEKTRRRIVVVGDSFTFGANLEDGATYPAVLAGLYGDRAEVVNLGVIGFGIDQMALAAAEHGLRLGADDVVLAFIADDLKRTCRRFGFTQLPKPHFRFAGDGVEPEGVPLPSRAEMMARHERYPQRVRDFLGSLLLKLRLASLLYEPFYAAGQRRCLEELNVRILQWTARRLEGKARFHVFHLDGALPAGFARRLAAASLPFESLEPAVPAMATKLRRTPGRSDTYHPDAALAAIYAQLLFDRLR